MSKAREIIRLVESIDKIGNNERDYIQPEDILNFIEKFLRKYYQNQIGNKTVTSIDILETFESEWHFVVLTEDIDTGETQDYAIQIKASDYGIYRVSQLPSAGVIKDQLVKWIDSIIRFS